MDNKIKSGQEIVTDFFDHLEEIPGVDSDIAGVLDDLYKENKLTHKNLSNALLRLRKREEAKHE